MWILLLICKQLLCESLSFLCQKLFTRKVIFEDNLYLSIYKQTVQLVRFLIVMQIL